jgi:hypothetical protein
VEARGLTAWASVVGDAPAFTREDVAAAHQVVSEIFERVEACLPARFPTILADEDALRGHLASRAEELVTRLASVRGAAEVAVTVLWTAPEEVPAGVQADTPGRRYLLERQAAIAGSDRRRARATDLAEVLEQQAGQGVRRTERRVCPSAEVALSLALLVDREAASDVCARLSLDSAQDVRILVNGPWPPYTFAT